MPPHLVRGADEFGIEPHAAFDLREPWVGLRGGWPPDEWRTNVRAALPNAGVQVCGLPEAGVGAWALEDDISVILRRP